MRVAHVLKAAGLSGAEAHLLVLSSALRAEGFDPRLIVLHAPNHPPADLIEAARERQVALDLVPLARDLDPGVLPGLLALIRSSRTQIVHTHMIHGDLYGTLAAQAARVTLVQTRHNDDRFRRRWPVKLLTRALAAPAKTVIAISQALAAFVRDVEGVPGPKITCIHYGLNADSLTAKARPGALRAGLGLDSQAPLVCAVGRLTEQKGFHHLVEAFARVRSAAPQARLIVAGDGPMRARLEAAAGGPGSGVHFLGWRHDVPSLLADCDVLAMPSLWEGFGMVALEAMALRKPVVASRVSALPEIVADGETGLLVPPADPEALAAALLALLNDPARARALGERGRARLDKSFTVQRMARQHVAVYKEAASRVPEFRA